MSIKYHRKRQQETKDINRNRKTIFHNPNIYYTSLQNSEFVMTITKTKNHITLFFSSLKRGDREKMVLKEATKKGCI